MKNIKIICTVVRLHAGMVILLILSKHQEPALKSSDVLF